MTQPKVLIAGASISGPALAHWLVKAGCDVTVVERAPALRENGQSVDLRNDGVRIMQWMGIEAEVRAKTTKEAGIQFVRDSGKPFASFGVTGDVDRQSFSSEFEIFRGDLGRILYDLTKDKVKYIFGDHIKSLTQNEKARTVTAEFHNGTPTNTYDLVVGCDGLNSKTRAMAFDTGVRDYVKGLYTYTAYFTIDGDLLKGGKFATVHHSTGGRSMYLRPDPDPAGRTRAGLNICFPKGADTDMRPLVDAERSGDQDKVKQLMSDLFKDVSWISKEIIQGMWDSKDFYSGEVAQVYIPTLHRGRIALCGDSGHCPSPISGSGTTSAFVSAYILAGEIGKSLRKGEDLDEALKRFDTEMIPRARKYQNLPPGTPQIANPQSAWGIKVFRFTLGFLSFTRLADVLGRISGLVSWGDGVGVPKYEWAA